MDLIRSFKYLKIDNDDSQYANHHKTKQMLGKHHNNPNKSINRYFIKPRGKIETTDSGLAIDVHTDQDYFWDYSSTLTDQILDGIGNVYGYNHPIPDHFHIHFPIVPTINLSMDSPSTSSGLGSRKRRSSGSSEKDSPTVTPPKTKPDMPDDSDDPDEKHKVRMEVFQMRRRITRFKHDLDQLIIQLDQMKSVTEEVQKLSTLYTTLELGISKLLTRISEIDKK